MSSILVSSEVKRNISKIAIHTLGCKLNFSESSYISKSLQENNYKIVDFDEFADAYVINTCSVTENADKKFKYFVRQAQKNNPNAVIAIGSIIQGETKHFDYVCQAVAHGIKDLNINSDVPVIFCVLTDSNIEQAKARSGGKLGNKGNEAAFAALKMAELIRNA